MIGFVNLGGFIETLGILGETPELEPEDVIAPLSLLLPRRLISLSCGGISLEEASATRC